MRPAESVLRGVQLSEVVRPEGDSEQSGTAPAHEGIGGFNREARNRRRLRTTGHVMGLGACLLFIATGTIFGHFYWNSDTFRDLVQKHWLTTARNIINGESPDRDWKPDRQFPQCNSINVLIL